MNIRSTIYLLAHSSNPEDKREWAVLYWKSQGLKHEEIAEKWGYSVKWVQRYMTHAYKRFEVPPVLNKYEKLVYLEQNVFPLIREFIADEPDMVRELPAPPDTEPAEEPEVVEPEARQSSVVRQDPAPIIIDPIINKRPSCLQRTLTGLFFLVVVAVVGYGAYLFGRRSAPQVPLPTAEVIIVTATFPPAAETPVLPETPLPTLTLTVPPTFTPPPTAIAFVPPADGILFQDDFESGDLSAWTQSGGQWLVSNGQLTILGEDVNAYKWIELIKPEWTNYVLSITINIPFQDSAAQSQVAVAVRNGGSQSKYLGVPIDTIRNRVFWAFMEGSRDTAIAGLNEGYYFESGSNMELEVQGDAYTLRVNGREIQKITISGYDSGGISLGIYCFFDLGCPGFDDVKVTYLP